jgi:hypothetical protein
MVVTRVSRWRSGRPLAISCWLPCCLLSLILCVSFLLQAVSAKIPPALDPDYVLALAAADHFLQAWQSGDVENGMALLTSHAKQTVNTDVLEEFFSHHEPSAYELNHGKLLTRGRYEFPVVLVTSASKNVRSHRRFTSIVVVDTGHKTGRWINCHRLELSEARS